MSKRAVLPLVWILVLFSASYVNGMEGIGISPACYGSDASGNCYFINITPNQTMEYEFRVFNFDNDTKEFRAEIEADRNLSGRLKLSPERFSLKQHNSMDCYSSPGCKALKVQLNATGLANGTYTVFVAAITTLSPGGAMNINQVVKAKVMLNVLHPPKNWKILYILAPVILIAFVIALIWLQKRKRPKKQKKEENEE